MDGLSWFDTDEESLPSLLIKAGYDVYVSNDRGTKNSLSHTEIDPIGDAKTYFDFSFAEIGMYDIPANLFFIKERARALPLTYIGYA